MTNLELYGTTDVPPINKEDCNRRIGMLRKRMGELVDSNDERSSYLLKKVMEAISFWERMRDGENDYPEWM